MNIQEFIEKYQPCPDGEVWLSKQTDMETAWNTCQRADWMLWVLYNIGYTNQRVLRRLACDFVRRTPLADGRTVLDLLTDERSRTAVEVAERHAEGQATDDELRASALDAGASAWASAWAAAWAAWDSAGAAVVARASALDAGAARAAARAAQANMIRARIAWQDIAPLLED